MDSTDLVNPDNRPNTRRKDRQNHVWQMFDSDSVYRHLFETFAAIAASFFESRKTHLKIFLFIVQAMCKGWHSTPVQLKC